MTLSQEHQIILDKYRVELVNSIDMNGLWSHLRSLKVITKADEERLKAQGTRLQQKEAFLDHLFRRPDKDYDSFCQCLQLTNQEHIVEEYLCPSADKGLAGSVNVRPKLTMNQEEWKGFLYRAGQK
ncbi:hypothetical protein CAPTEDRAFT_192254 [Capitella teleta]|uniref:CARD domain-containing protein n=1 Tax=Capitella teleta TaxID=283909 RepID=R7UDV4_CAPTE|nr:hypothetical protein CAPTEDRAFT_192254 [Capitella teleta]|eukprot:ELU04291.1 hypothetical protein CAPTEDRAFT_192254 [Capitella teleta]